MRGEYVETGNSHSQYWFSLVDYKILVFNNILSDLAFMQRTHRYKHDYQWFLSGLFDDALSY